jgi:hypothetical protein
MQKLSWAGAFVIAALLTSCSAEWHHEKACKKAPIYCMEWVRLDTVVYRDSIEIYEVFETQLHDTIIIDTGSVRVEIIRDHDIIRTYVKQKPDTTRITITKQMPPRIIYRDKVNWWWLILIPLLLWLIYKK